MEPSDNSLIIFGNDENEVIRRVVKTRHQFTNQLEWRQRNEATKSDDENPARLEGVHGRRTTTATPTIGETP